MRYRNRSVIACGAAIAALAMGPSHPAMAQAETYTEATTFSLTEVFFHDCTGEEVLFSGEIHSINHFTRDSEGGLHYVGTGVRHMMGVGLTTGARYVMTAPNPSHLNFGAVQEDVLISHFTIVTAGTNNNLRGHFTWHLTLNDNGEAGLVVNDWYDFCSRG